MGSRMRTSENRGVRCRRQRSLSAGPGEGRRLLRQPIEVGCQNTLRSHQPHAVGAPGVERDQDNVARCWIRF